MSRDRSSTFQRCRSNAGFTLIELALVLTIVGFLSVFGMTMVSAQIDSQRQKVSTERLSVIRNALVTFLAKSHRLPCPARGDLPSTDANYGVEAALVPGATPNCNGTDSISTDAEGAVDAQFLSFRGIVPWKTLGLSASDVEDGHFRFFTYRVSRAGIFGTDGNARTALNIAAMRGVLTIHTGAPTFLGLPATGNQVNACSTTKSDNGCNTAAVVVLVSHGKDGYGARLPLTGALLAFPAGLSAVDARANADANNSYVVREFSNADNEPFDDFVLGLSPSDIIDTLARSGSIQDARARTLERIFRIRDALLWYGAENLRLPDPTGTCSCEVPNVDLGLSQSDIEDGWGTLFTYTSLATSGNSLKVPGGVPGGTIAYAIRSWGVNQLDNTCASDDMCLSASASEVRGKLIGAGVELD